MMPRAAKRILLCGLFSLLAACDNPAPTTQRPLLTIEGKTMGTFYSVKN